MHDVIVFLSTPRCATQWIAHILAASYSDRLLVRHEPLGFAYQPNRFFRRSDLLAAYATLPAIVDHLDWVDDLRRHTTYVEIGYQNYAAIPLFIDRFAPNLKIIHHVRHPVTTAASLVSHRWYQNNLRTDLLNELGLLDPFSSGAIHHAFADRWHSLSPFGKSLFFWSEINAYGFEIQSRYDNQSFLRTRLEDLTGSNTDSLRSMIDFMELPYRRQLDHSYQDKIDRWRRRSVVKIDWDSVDRHPEVVGLAEALGYAVDDVDMASVRKRIEPAMRFVVSPLYAYLMDHPAALQMLRRLRKLLH